MDQGLKQSDIAQLVACNQITISRAERGLPIQRWVIDKFVALSRGSLTRDDFKEQSPKRKRKHGSQSIKGRGRKKGSARSR